MINKNNSKVTMIASTILAATTLIAPVVTSIGATAPVALADVNDAGTVKTDKTKLNAIYGKVTNAHMDDTYYADYTPVSVKEMKETYANAGKIVNDNNATQAQIDQATGALEQAFANMEKLVNDSQLTQEIEAAKKIDQSKYTSSSVVYLRVAITSAEITSKSGTMTSEQRSNQYWALKAAEGYLVNKTATNDQKPVPNNDTNNYTNDELKQQLAALVNQAGNLNDSYSQQNFDSNYIFIQAKNYANTLTGANVNVSNDTLKTAIGYLTDAVTARMDIVDGVKMTQAIETAKQIDQAIYSDSSAAVFKAAISNAQAALANYQNYENFSYFKSPEATPVKDMNRAYHNLEAAKANLVNKTDLDHEGHTDGDRQAMLSAVKTSLKAAQSIDTTLYEEASVATLKQAIKDTNDLLNNTTPSYDQLNTANKNLTAAINGLKLKQNVSIDKDGNKVTHNADGSTTTVTADGTTTTVFSDGTKKVVDKNGNVKWYDAKGNEYTPNNNNSGNNSNNNSGNTGSNNHNSGNTDNNSNDGDTNDNPSATDGEDTPDPSDTQKKVGHEPNMKPVKTGINAQKDNKGLIATALISLAGLLGVGSWFGLKKKKNQK